MKTLVINGRQKKMQNEGCGMEKMKTTEEILYALECGNPRPGDCDKCAYHLWDCLDESETDAVKLIRRLTDENRAMHTELTVNLGAGLYWRNICEMNRKQEKKGLEKYGEPLESNTTLTTEQRIEHLEEELIDGLKYCEHLKAVGDDGITANDYQRACMRTAPKDVEEWLENAIYGIVGETGEIVDIVKKWKWQGHEIDYREIALELGDLLWYCALLSNAVNFRLGTVMQMNIDKLKERYPEGFSKERSVNRDKD